MDHDPVGCEGDLRRVGVHIACRIGIALDVVAPVRTAEELHLQSVFQRLRGNFQLNSVGCGRSRQQGKKQAQGEFSGIHRYVQCIR